MKTTANYGLKKPEGNDTVNIDDLNYNADVVDQKIKAVETDITNLKTHVDNGKSSLYSAIVGKKVTPRSKDFTDLVEGIKEIKLGQGNAQASQVLSGKTFTNDSGIVQTGSMPSYANKVITPNKNKQHLSNGYYQGIDVSAITNDTIKNNFNDNEIINLVNIENVTNDKLKNIVSKISQKDPSLAGKKWATGNTTLSYPYALRVLNLNFKPSIVLIETSRGSSNVTFRCIKSPIIELDRPFELSYSKYKTTDGELDLLDNGFICTRLFDLQVTKREIPVEWIAIE